jgi:predicted component of type VI protein secretion system
MSDVLSPTLEKLLNDDRNAEERIAKMLFEVHMNVLYFGVFEVNKSL